MFWNKRKKLQMDLLLPYGTLPHLEIGVFLYHPNKKGFLVIVDTYTKEWKQLNYKCMLGLSQGEIRYIVSNALDTDTGVGEGKDFADSVFKYICKLDGRLKSRKERTTKLGVNYENHCA